MDKTIYSVILRSDILPRERQFFEMYCFKITSDSGFEDLLEFRCTKIDVSHHNYIEMEILAQRNQELFPLRIPHHLVAMIHGSEDQPSPGFGI